MTSDGTSSGGAGDGERDGFTRRQVVGTAGGIGVAVAAAGLLSACGGGGATSSSAGTTGAQPAGGTPKRGGELRVGVYGGSEADTLDANQGISLTDTARGIALYDTLTRYSSDLKTEMILAESLEPNKDATEWTLRLRDGIEFHNGKALEIDDVLFTFERIVKEKLFGATILSPVNLGAVKKLDKLTAKIPMHFGYITLPSATAQISLQIVPRGYDPKNPVGTGPFQYKSFTPGQNSVFTRFANFREKGKPYVDVLEITDFNESSALVNALIGGTVDVIDQVLPSQVPTIEARGNLALSEASNVKDMAITMQLDKPPFDDVRVRQALKYIVDRQQLVEQAASAKGSVANDVLGAGFPSYDTSIPQREQDLEKAKALLKQAGAEDLTVELTTSNVATGIVPMCQVFAQQASAAGINVKVKEVTPTQFFVNYGTYPMAVEYLYGLEYLLAASFMTTTGAPFNTSNQADPKYDALWKEANAITDENKRFEIEHAMQLMEHEESGLIMPFFPNVIGASGDEVVGLKTAKSGVPLGNYQFEDTGFAV